jgi:hypothetical protein
MSNQNPNTLGGSNMGVIIAIVLLVLSLPCCAGLLLLGGLLFFRADRTQPPAPPQPAQSVREIDQPVSISPQEKPADAPNP